MTTATTRENKRRSPVRRRVLAGVGAFGRRLG
jgi:hypothetical protein